MKIALCLLFLFGACGRDEIALGVDIVEDVVDYIDGDDDCKCDK